MPQKTHCVLRDHRAHPAKNMGEHYPPCTEPYLRLAFDEFQFRGEKIKFRLNCSKGAGDLFRRAFAVLGGKKSKSVIAGIPSSIHPSIRSSSLLAPTVYISLG